MSIKAQLLSGGLYDVRTHHQRGWLGTASFSPLDLEGGALWLDSTDLDTITKDESENVSQWDDKFATGRNAFASGVAQPVYSADGMTFDGANTFMQIGTSLSDFTFLHDGTGATVFIVFKTAVPNPLVDYSLLANTLGSSSGMFMHSTDGAFNDSFRTRINAITSPVINLWADAGIAPQETTNIISTRYGTEAGLANDFFSYADNVQQDNADNLVAPDTGNPVFQMFLGTTPNINVMFNGHIKEIIIYDRKLSVDEHTQVYEYLKKKVYNYLITDSGDSLVTDSGDRLIAG
ncbi:MAG: hypothetical protein U9O94_00715 [Nanoarchaeota archaeon]|nr:hypothetical protein [Nanoarchaeota archaeon]